MKAKPQSTPSVPPTPALQPTRQEKLQSFLQGVELKVAGMLESDSLAISKKKTPYVQTKEQVPHMAASRLKEVQMSRESMQSRLMAITQEEQTLRNQIKNSSMNGQSKVSPIRPRSELSPLDISLLKKLKKEQKEFQRSLDQKTKAHEEMQLAAKKQEEELQRKQKEQNCEERRKEIKARLAVLQQQRIERERIFQQERRKLVQVKASRKLFQEKEATQKQAERALFEQKVSAMQARMREKEVDLHAIQEHEEKYEQTRAEQLAERSKRLREQARLARQREKELQNVDKSKYYTLTLGERQRLREQREEKERQRRDLVEAAREYAEQVKRQRSPRIRTKTSSSSKSAEPRGLSPQEIKRRGNAYMQQARSLLRATTQKKQPTPTETTHTKDHYRDYLSEQRLTRVRQKTPAEGIKDSSIRRELEEVRRIMGSGTERRDKLQRVRDIAHKLQVKGQDHNMLDKIAAKLKILQSLSSAG